MLGVGCVDAVSLCAVRLHVAAVRLCVAAVRLHVAAVRLCISSVAVCGSSEAVWVQRGCVCVQSPDRGQERRRPVVMQVEMPNGFSAMWDCSQLCRFRIGKLREICNSHQRGVENGAHCRGRAGRTVGWGWWHEKARTEVHKDRSMRTMTWR